MCCLEELTAILIEEEDNIKLHISRTVAVTKERIEVKAKQEI